MLIMALTVCAMHYILFVSGKQHKFSKSFLDSLLICENANFSKRRRSKAVPRA